MPPKQFLVAVAAAALWGAACGADEMSKDDAQRGAALMREQMSMMTPELVERARSLAPEIRQFLMHVALRHERRSDTLTLAQVMQEILADYQAVGAAIATDHGALAADAAERIALHRLPRGGMLPYLPLDKVTNEGLGVLPAMEAAVEGNATQLAQAARRGDMIGAAQHYGAMTAGCVACHAHFRGQPGGSAYVPRLLRR